MSMWQWHRPVVITMTVLFFYGITAARAIGVNWGTQSTHPLEGGVVAKLLRDNGFDKVKLFEADPNALEGLKNSGVEVMVGIPNDMLAVLANSVQAAEKWVSQNVSKHVSKNGINLRYVAVGNEPFLTTFNGTYIPTTLPALENIQSAIIKAGLATQVKVTVPLNADVYQSQSNIPSEGDFRSDIRDLMLRIVKFLNDNGAPFTINIYPFISLYNDPGFPVDFAFFDSAASSPINDGGRLYTNVLDANYDTLVWTLQKYGFGKMPIIVGEIGWPTDGDRNANIEYARRFNQGFMNRQKAGKGTPLRSGPIDAYLFSLIDEDNKSVEPGNFERHWGLFYFDGQPKYQLSLGPNPNSGLVPARGVRYLSRKWCVLSPSANLQDPDVATSVSYACGHGDCTSLGYGTSCGNLDARGNISYAFNSYYQINDQLDTACKFPKLSVVTNQDPSTPTCKFRIMIQTDAEDGVASSASWGKPGIVVLLFLSLFLVL